MDVDSSTQLNESTKNSNASLNKCENDISASGKRGSNSSNLSSTSERSLTSKGDGSSKLFQDRRRLRKHEGGEGDGYNKEWMDIERKKIQAYEYLCHVEEAKEWIERCIDEKINSKEFEEQLRRGIVLAKLAKIIQPGVVKKIFDAEKLQYRHSDNINYLFTVMRNINFPEIFIFELTDLYDKKNIPKVIYCLHALSHFLQVTGFLHPAVKDLVGKLEFSEEQLNIVQENFEENGLQLPQFSNVEAALQKEIGNTLTEEEKRNIYYTENSERIIKAQSIVRGYLARKKFKEEYGELLENKGNIIKIQAATRGFLQRKKFNDRKKYLKDNEATVIKLQAMARGKRARKEYLKKKNYYDENIDKIIKLQSYFRRAIAMKYYNELKNGNISAEALHNYLAMAGGNSLDYDYESEMEFLREIAIRKIRENLELEREVNTLDVKIELLVKNQISLQEIVHSSKKKKKNAQNTETVESIFSNKTPDKESRRKYKLYQNLFYLVQTNQKYLAKLMIRLNSIGSSQIKTIENTVMSLYGYAQNNREEYLLLNLIKRTIEYEVEDINDINDFWRVNPIFIKLVLHYCRGAKERQYIRDLLQPLVKSVISCEGLELESDPIAIYKTLIRDEEYKTGQPSKRKYDVTAKEALTDEETKKMYIIHLQKLKEITTKFLDAIIASLPNMPYSIRCIAMELSSHFMEKWPNNQNDVTKILGNLIYYRYINPAICAPEAFDVIESVIDQTQRKNLAEISKLLHNISVNKPFADDNPWLQPLNEYISIAGNKFASFFTKVACVETAEAHFQIDEFDDLTKTSNPVIFISPKEIIEVHSCILEHIEDIEINENDPLRIILKDLGDPVTTETSEKEITLTLVNRFADVNDDGTNEKKHLLRKTKNMVIDILRIQNGKNILDILQKPSTDVEEKEFQELLDQKIINEELLEKKKEEERRELEKNSNLNDKSNPNSPHNSNNSINKSSGNVTKSSASISKSSGNVTKSSASISKSSGNITKSSNSISKSQNELEAKENGIGKSQYLSISLHQLKESTFADYKKMAAENLEELEGYHEIKKEDNYQTLLNIIGKEIKNKNIQREKKIAEIKKLKQTIENLKQKEDYLLSQKDTYNNYIDMCRNQLSNSKKPNKKPTIFSRQYYYLKKLEKEGKVPKFGSYQYTAEQLYKRGVLVSIEGISQKMYSAIKFTISSDEVGVFNIVAKTIASKIFEPIEIVITLDELLQAKYDEIQILSISDDTAKVNVNLLLHLINKKFYV
ncbi:hypothetical protein BCR32DRAFT_218164 [Anaeromyces robustus]|uniref:Rho GTPase activation protein n=1 Tax=Anaeromyces robustus TaxID=1754192 RepID=A0A1Y1XED1_9FUNG|nr:hypothetical protein BCR32DRAFT_218164 [Anaeromyces robustus]|eukprot:ORX84099.1 hypothetical protein BCR32DRAFT_218164 [Anaeromyces robustus]